MAKSNAQRQAEYRTRRAQHQVSPQQMKFLLWAAYCLGREDEMEKREGCGGSLDKVEQRSLDRYMNDELDRERRWGTYHTENDAYQWTGKT